MITVKPYQMVRGMLLEGNKRPTELNILFNRNIYLSIMRDKESQEKFILWLRECFNALECKL